MQTVFGNAERRGGAQKKLDFAVQGASEKTNMEEAGDD